jgi:hypothetical protein
MNKLRILFLVISNMSLLSGSDLEDLMNKYEDLKTQPRADERTLRNQILLLHHTPEWKALKVQKESEKLMKWFKGSSPIQMSRARWAHENGVSGEGVDILILEVKKRIMQSTLTARLNKLLMAPEQPFKIHKKKDSLLQATE